MKYYLSDSWIGKDIEEFAYPFAKNRLISFHYKKQIERYIEIYRAYNGTELDISEYSLMIDSGAYSVWNSGKAPINIYEYAWFCIDLLKELRDMPFKTVEFINLDVIPGERDKPVTKAHIDKAQTKSWENYEWLKERVPNVMPVFHQGDDFKYLEMMNNETLRYCVSPANDKSTQQRLMWIQDVFRKASSDFKPHGLGFASDKIADANPWYSFDAATHGLASAYGHVMYSNGQRFVIMCFSNKRQSDELGTHFLNMPKPERDIILSELIQLNERFTYDNLVKDGKLRRMVNMYYLVKHYENRKSPKNLIQANLFE
tara:strand:- start:540 stop:1484 length:945 start_codon:yes stop_codon:yes gene_type:complete